MNFAAVRINISLPDGRELAVQEALSPDDLDGLSLLLGDPPLPDMGPFALFEWQRKRDKCVEACNMLGQKIARALQKTFRDQRWAPR